MSILLRNAPSEDLGGRYSYDPDYDYRKNFDAGFAPGCPSGQWVPALARAYAITGDQATREKVRRLNRLYAVYASLTNSHHSFETPCGSYAHFKLTWYLLRVTRDARYGDSMERMMYNTVLGAKPLQVNCEAFYYSDYTFEAKRV